MTVTFRKELEETARSAGWNLCGLVDAANFDATQPAEGRCARAVPGCGTAVVFATAGAAHWQQDTEKRDVIARLRGLVGHSGVRGRVVPATCGGKRINFNRLGEAAGLGVVSPVLGVLLHPRYGPWVGMRAAVLLEGHPFGPIEDRSMANGYTPCATCARPCLDACPVPGRSAMADPGTNGCLEHWQKGGCTVGCAARAACPVGAAERCTGSAESARHGEAMRSLLLRHGRGPWTAMRRLLDR